MTPRKHFFLNLPDGSHASDVTNVYVEGSDLIVKMYLRESFLNPAPLLPHSVVGLLSVNHPQVIAMKQAVTDMVSRHGNGSTRF